MENNHDLMLSIDYSWTTRKEIYDKHNVFIFLLYNIIKSIYIILYLYSYIGMN